MMKRKLFGLTFILLLLSACGSSEPTTVAGTSVEKPAADEQASTAGGSSPVDAMLGIPVMDEGAFNDFLIGVIAQGERRTAECMLAAGFDYTPETPAINGPSASENTDSREYAEQNGFGIVAAFEAATFDDAAPRPPNQKYIASLSDGESDAYQMALFGEPTREEEFDEDGGFPSVGTGCKALAIEELGAVFAVMDEFGPAAEDIFEQLDADPRMLQTNKTWSQCMAEAGYVASNRNEVRDELIWQRLEPVFDGDDIYVESDADLERFDTSGVWSEFLSGDTFGAHPPLTVEGQALIDEVGAFERAVAVASFDCHDPLREAELEVQREYEQLVVDRIGGDIAARLGDD